MAKRLILTALLALASAVLAGPALACPPTWTVVPSPSYASGEDQIRDLTVISENVAWNVVGSDHGAVVQRWNGTSWTTRLGPLASDSFSAVDAAGGLVWVGGAYYHPASGEFRSRIRRWNGSNWSVTPTPHPGGDHTRVEGIAAISATDVWAVGSYAAATGGWKPLLLHWDGASWTRTPPPVSVTGDLYGIWAHATDDIWAVGREGDFTGAPLTLHYDGLGWTAYPGATPEDDNVLLDVTRSPDGLWNAAGYGETDPDPQRPLNHVLMGPPFAWGDGSPFGTVGIFNGNASLGYEDLWLAGTTPTGAGVLRTLVKRWTTFGWDTFPTPNLPGDIEGLNGIRRTPAGNLWAFGFRNDYTATLTARVCPVKVEDGGFDQPSATVAQGSTVAWTFPTTNAVAHGFSDTTGMLLFDVVRNPGAGFHYRYNAAGSYPNTSDVNGVTAFIRVPVVAERDGSTSDIAVTWAASELGAGFRADVQVRRNAGPWTVWLDDTPDRVGVYTAPSPGAYRFRARLVRPAASGSTSGWSPVDSVVIP